MGRGKIKGLDIGIRILYVLNFGLVIILFIAIWVLAKHPEYISYLKKFF
ncbi:hypothetical protein [Bacillus sp. T33-2]|nr:hypothetical protein [Bacillus sp. T33-2]